MLKLAFILCAALLVPAASLHYIELPADTIERMSGRFDETKNFCNLNLSPELSHLPKFDKFVEAYDIRWNADEDIRLYPGANQTVYDTCRKFLQNTSYAAVPECTTDVINDRQYFIDRINQNINAIWNHFELYYKLGVVKDCIDLFERQITKDLKMLLAHCINFMPYVIRCAVGGNTHRTIEEYIELCQQNGHDYQQDAKYKEQTLSLSINYTKLLQTTQKSSDSYPGRANIVEKCGLTE